ncbi:MAG: hypothetical protein KKF62_15265 [Bacteroidetes bacterium]|nr:hypothetical protein [Bacteroidota bacterium]MBU1114502.1 hypothetical protein [Bacteroidota bacterium]MBU1799294.1 hypothetical protein [Bacteroidota bacterium]
MRYIFALLMAFTLFSCSENKTTDTSSKDSTNSVNNELVLPPLADNFYLKYKFNIGDKFSYKIKTISSSSQELQSDSTMKTNVNQTVEYKINFLIDDVDANKLAKINVLVESILINGVINGQHISYDSKYIQSSQEKMMFAQYEAIKNHRFSLDVTESGEIVKIYNTDIIVNELLAIQPQKVTKAQKKELQNNFIESALRPLSEQIFRKFPTEKVSIKYNWTEKYYSQFALFKIENVATFQILDFQKVEDDSVVTMSANLSINWVGEHDASDQGMTFYFYDPKVSGSGKINFNFSSGLIINSQTRTDMEMVTDISGLNENKIPFKAKRIDNTSNTNIVTLIN